MYPCASTTAGNGPRPVGTFRTPEIVYDSSPRSVVELLRKVTSYDVYAAVRSRTAPRRSRSPRWRCSASPGTETGFGAGSLGAGSLVAGGLVAGSAGGSSVVADGVGRVVGAAAPSSDPPPPEQPASRTAPSTRLISVRHRVRIAHLQGRPPSGLHGSRGDPPSPTGGRDRSCRTRGVTARRRPRWSELRPLLRPTGVQLDRTGRRLARAASVDDLRSLARRRAPRAVFDYTDGAAGQEIALRRAREAFGRVEFRPRVLNDVSDVDTSTTILGRPSALPLVLAPTGFTRMMHTEGEPAVARVAARVGIPYALSTMGTTSVEDLAAGSPDARLWFQLYLWRDRGASRDFVERARDAGYEALMLTVDTPVPGARLRDVRNGLTIPPTLSMRTFAEGATHPGWWFDLLTTEPLEFASLNRFEGTVAELVGRMFDPSITMADLTWLRSVWPGSLVVKGVQHVDDARAVVDAGADAVVVSSHGGRQLDRAPVPLESLAGVVDAVGDRAEVYVDSGILSGSDLVAAVALGARAGLVGRAYLYGLMAGGERGVQRAAEILKAEVATTMALLGVTRVEDLGRDHVRLRPC